MPANKKMRIQSSSSEPRLPVVAIVACDGFAPFQLSVPCVIFGNFIPDVLLFNVRVCAVENHTLHNEFGMMIDTPHKIDSLDEADVIVIPFWRSPDERPPEPLLKALRVANERGAKIVGLCLGGYVLAYAGLLDDRHASTHWEVVEDFRSRFPKVQLDETALFVEDGNLVTSAGTGAGIDCCLSIVRDIYGSGIANQVAQRLVIPYCRDGGQAQYVKNPISKNTEGARLERVIAHIEANLDKCHDVGSLATRAGMSRRSFTRHFSKKTGMSVGAWLLAQRLQQAQLLLETTDTRIESIAEQVGFPSAVAFRKHFQAKFTLAPTAWRKMKTGKLEQAVVTSRRAQVGLPRYGAVEKPAFSDSLLVHR